MRRQLYNPCLSSLINNHRDLANAKRIPHIHLDNQTILDLINDNTGYSTHEEDNEAFLEALQYHNDQLNKPNES